MFLLYHCFICGPLQAYLRVFTCVVWMKQNYNLNKEDLPKTEQDYLPENAISAQPNLNSWAVPSYHVAYNMLQSLGVRTVARDLHTMATLMYVVETVRSAVRRLKKTCAFQCHLLLLLSSSSSSFLS